MSTELLVGTRVLRAIQGDLTQTHADALVNAANEPLVGGGGVDGAIHYAGGPDIMADLVARYGQKRRCPTGQAVLSNAGLLPARWVVHAVGPIWHGGNSGEAELLASAYRHAFRVASEAGARTVASAALSAGAYGYPLEAAATIAVAAAIEHLSGPASSTSVERIEFVLFSERTLAAFERVLEYRRFAAL